MPAFSRSLELKKSLVFAFSLILISCASQLPDLPQEIPHCTPALPSDQNTIQLVVQSAAQPQRDLLLSTNQYPVVVNIFEPGRGNYKYALPPGGHKSLSAQGPIGETRHPTVSVFSVCSTLDDAQQVVEIDESMKPRPYP